MISNQHFLKKALPFPEYLEVYLEPGFHSNLCISILLLSIQDLQICQCQCVRKRLKWLFFSVIEKLCVCNFPSAYSPWLSPSESNAWHFLFPGRGGEMQLNPQKFINVQIQSRSAKLIAQICLDLSLNNDSILGVILNLNNNFGKLSPSISW